MFRWAVYQVGAVVLGLCLMNGIFSDEPTRFRVLGRYHIYKWDVEDTIPAVLIWILLFVLPAVWVFRKPLWKAVGKAIGFLNKKADEG